ncbi:MAG: molybdopterin-dependent oxidoreductase [Acidobacteriota bacterium]|nr:molybdopterin-dependent oxidoreductase [Acidobacteriota bacterium]
MDGDKVERAGGSEKNEDLDYRPWTWTPPEDFSKTLPGITRQDAYEKVSGTAVFTRDIHLPGMLYAKILLSPYANARIKRMDTSKARALEGVRDVLEHTDPDIAGDRATGYWYEIAGNYSILTLPGGGDFYQHPMGVAVVAEDEETCDRALRLVEIEWEERPFVLDMEQAAKPDAVKVMADADRTNAKAREPNIIVADRAEYGDVAKGFAEADVVIEYKVTREVNSSAGPEPAVCVAQWRGGQGGDGDFLDIWVHHHDIPQWGLISSIGADAEGKPRPPLAEWSKITVTMPFQGAMYGGFSWQQYSTCFNRLAVILARRAGGRPVKLLFDENPFYVLGDDAGTYTCKVGAKKDGTITAYHWHVVGPRNAAVEKTYEGTKIPNILGTFEWALTNKGHFICFRHGANSCVPHNVMFDRVAGELGLDPTEVALKNDGCRGHDWEWVTRYQEENGFPQRWSLKEVIDKGKAAIGWDGKWHKPGARRLPNGRLHGLGFMQSVEWTCEAPAPAKSHACLMLRNGICAIVGVRSDIGSDSESGARHTVAAELGLRYEDVIVHQRRSDNSSFYMWQPGGSFSTAFINTQLVMAARELKRKLLSCAVKPTPPYNTSHFYKTVQPPAFPGKRPEDLDIKDSVVFEKANPSNRKTLREVADIFWDVDPAIAYPVTGTVQGLTVDGKPDDTYYTMARQAHFIEVEVDDETGMVDVTDIVCVNDVGHLFNPKGAEAQQYGGAIMGLGRSGTEEHVWCPRTGVALNKDLVGYHIGTMNDYPRATGIVNESHLGYAAFGAYGLGENPAAAMSGITASAIFNATGKWVMDYPTTPDRVLRALGKI